MTNYTMLLLENTKIVMKIIKSEIPCMHKRNQERNQVELYKPYKNNKLLINYTEEFSRPFSFPHAVTIKLRA